MPWEGSARTTEWKPARVTPERHPSYPQARRWIVERTAVHRTTRYLNNFVEQSHSAIRALLPVARLRKFRVGVRILRGH